MQVREIMTKELIRLKPEDSAHDALNLLFQKEISGLPVIDEAGKLLGMFTEKDILKQILPSYVEKVGRFIYTEDPKYIKKKLQDLMAMKVSQLMRKEVVTVSEETSLVEIARIMLTQKIRRIPILAADGQVSGIVSRGDIVKALADKYGARDTK